MTEKEAGTASDGARGGPSSARRPAQFGRILTAVAVAAVLSSLVAAGLRLGTIARVLYAVVGVVFVVQLVELTCTIVRKMRTRGTDAARVTSEPGHGGTAHPGAPADQESLGRAEPSGRRGGASAEAPDPPAGTGESAASPSVALGQEEDGGLSYEGRTTAEGTTHQSSVLGNHQSWAPQSPKAPFRTDAE